MPLSILANEIYQMLRPRVPQANLETCKITYMQLVQALGGAPYADLHWRDPRLDDALGELVAACRVAGLPAISALVVNGETRRPGRRYYDVAHPNAGGPLQQEIAWAQELQGVAATQYPPAL